MADTTEQARDFARSLISHPVAFGTIEHIEKAGEMLTALLAERDALKQTLHDELDANLRLRDLGEQAREALHEIAEEWAGAECGEPVHAQEAYAIGLAKRMYAIAAAALAQEPAHTDHPARHFDRTCPASELRGQAVVLRRLLADALAVLRTIDEGFGL